LAVPYARERFAGHRKALESALAVGYTAGEQALRNIAPGAEPALLLGP
jgi:hypothetical protein